MKINSFWKIQPPTEPRDCNVSIQENLYKHLWMTCKSMRTTYEQSVAVILHLDFARKWGKNPRGGAQNSKKIFRGVTLNMTFFRPYQKKILSPRIEFFINQETCIKYFNGLGVKKNRGWGYFFLKLLQNAWFKKNPCFARTTRQTTWTTCVIIFLWFWESKIPPDLFFFAQVICRRQVVRGLRRLIRVISRAARVVLGVVRAKRWNILLKSCLF